MIFRIKHRWRIAAAVTVAWAGVNFLLGGWHGVTGGRLSLPAQIGIGAAGAALAMLINGALHEGLKRLVGAPYVARFDAYARDVIDGMRGRECVAGGLMAALAEETFFRGVVLRAIDGPVLAVAVSALLFAAAHWLRPRYFCFWLWAMWEGVLFGTLYVATGSLLVPMIAHGLHDLVAYRLFIFMTSGSRGACSFAPSSMTA
ncbi:MAG: hypothetical protein CMJ18_19820 [Phycisphaeraceae bacterium]|nr:hypothetical protein [Phycisphaeraceae bacterium]